MRAPRWFVLVATLALGGGIAALGVGSEALAAAPVPPVSTKNLPDYDCPDAGSACNPVVKTQVGTDNLCKVSTGAVNIHDGWADKYVVWNVVPLNGGDTHQYRFNPIFGVVIDQIKSDNGKDFSDP